MVRGKIKTKLDDRGFGFIRPDDGGKDVWFHASKVRGSVPFADLAVGMVVEYEAVEGDRGPQARSVRAVAGETPQQAAPRDDAAAQGGSGYRFLNPYNFVRFLPEGSPTKPVEVLLGRCLPPPHDRFVGLSGQIVCQVKTVTPLFVSDSEDIKPEGNDHKSYRFFRAADKHALPGSTLRGMVRSVFEVVTNSCYAKLADGQLSYRLPAAEAPDLRAAVVTCLPDVQNQRDGEVRLLKHAWMHRTIFENAATETGVLAALVKDATWSREEPFDQYFAKVLKDQTLPIRVRLRQKVRQRHADFGGKSYPYPFDEVLEIVAVGEPGNELSKPENNLFWGFLKITGPNVIQESDQGGQIVRDLRKHDERFFYWDGKEKRTARLPWQALPGREGVVARYNSVRVAQQDPANQQLPYVTYLQNESLSVGDLVWVRLEDNGSSVRDIGSVSIPKLRYERGILDCLPEHLHACSCYDTLCPACRVFGWVADPAPENTALRAAYAGRVRFSHGKLQGEAKTIPHSVTLAILSSPKPTTAAFYLLLRDDKDDRAAFQIGEGRDAPHVGYDTGGAVLRGRKVYRRPGNEDLTQKYPDDTHEYERPGGTPDIQNRTLRENEVLTDNNTFTFTVDFENLAPVELGALLWALEMEKGWVHRVGLAKPLGFGCVSVQVQSLNLMAAAERYVSLSASGKRTVPEEQWKKDYVGLFKTALGSRYGGLFDELKNVQDLRHLLAEQPGMPVHYPRSPFQRGSGRDPKGKQYEWFMGNARKTHCALEIPGQENGFPLVDREGRPL